LLIVPTLESVATEEGVMRWSFWPVSISVHVVVVLAIFIVPLTADVSWPVPAPLHPLTLPIKVAAVPPEVVARVPAPRSVMTAPSVAPPTLVPPDPAVPTIDQFDVPPIKGYGDGPIDPALIGPSTMLAPTPPVPPPAAPKPAEQIFRVGQGVKEPRRIAGASPEYPALARSARVQGVVILEAVINERGTIERVRVLKSVPLLDGAAIAAVKDWRYTPTLLNGVPVSVLMTITVNFTLQD
jgi:periplasmic protein TonB